MAVTRLDKFLADAGVASRRELKSIIKSGRVSLNGSICKKPETKFDSDCSEVCLDGTALGYKKYRYFMLNKPCGVVTATEDREQKTVMEILPPELKKLGLFPVGRLDKDTSGLLILTNDGEFAHKVISPKFSVEKCYHAQVDGIPDEEDAKAFEEGIVLRDGYKCLPAKLIISGTDSCRVILQEGKYHQVRRMLASRGKTVLKLKRLSVGSLILDENLQEGQCKELEEKDLCRVFSNE